MTDGVRARNFIHFLPKKKFIHLKVEVADRNAWTERLEEAGLATTIHGDRWLRVTVTPKDVEKHRELLAELVQRAVVEFRSE